MTEAINHLGIQKFSSKSYQPQGVSKHCSFPIISSNTNSRLWQKRLFLENLGHGVEYNRRKKGKKTMSCQTRWHLDGISEVQDYFLGSLWILCYKFHWRKYTNTSQQHLGSDSWADGNGDCLVMLQTGSDPHAAKLPRAQVGTQSSSWPSRRAPLLLPAKESKMLPTGCVEPIRGDASWVHKSITVAI